MKRVFSRMDKSLLFIIIAFFLFGLVMVLSASSMESYMRYGYGPYHYFYRQVIFVLIGMVLFFIVIRIPTKVYSWIAFFLMIGIIIVLGGLLVYGHISNNAQSWFRVGGISIQPSEFAKVISIVFLACYYARKKEELNQTSVLLSPILFVFIIFCLVLLQPDLGTAFIIGMISFLMFFSLPMPRKMLFKFSSMIVLFVGFVVLLFVATDGKILKSYQMERFNFFDPCERYQEDSGYQLCNSFIAFKNGGITGQGIGKSTQKYLYLPESYTDFIFPIIVEEWGVIVGCLIIMGYLFVIYRLYHIARRAVDLRGSLLAYGVCAYVFLHVVVNLVGVMGLGPLTGVPLPFLSYGGSYVLSLVVALGIAERVAIESSIQERKKRRRKRKEA